LPNGTIELDIPILSNIFYSGLSAADYDVLIRGGLVLIEEGYKADIALIDLNGIKTPTSIHNPHRYSEGVSYLLVNGETVIDGCEWTGALPGEIIKLKK